MAFSISFLTDILLPQRTSFKININMIVLLLYTCFLLILSGKCDIKQWPIKFIKFRFIKEIHDAQRHISNETYKYFHFNNIAYIRIPVKSLFVLQKFTLSVHFFNKNIYIIKLWRWHVRMFTFIKTSPRISNEIFKEGVSIRSFFAPRRLEWTYDIF